MTINNDALMFGGDDIPSLRNIDGLHKYLTSSIVRPAVPDLETLANLTGEQLEELNRSRLDYLSGGLVVSTPQMTKIIIQAERLIVENQGRNSGLHGLIIHGESTMGKTTTAKAVMRRIFFKYSQAYPEMDRENRIPIVYVEVPPGASAKALARRFADFLQLPVPNQETSGSTMQRVVNLLDRAGTRLVIVDELHNLKLRTSGAGEAVDFLKSLSNQLHATFIYAGIELNDSELFAGARGQQITGRFTSAPLRAFTWSTDEDRNLWREVVEAFEADLCLANHKPGDLGPLTGYLHERTGGSIGSLGRLLTGTASWLIYRGCLPEDERLTKELLEETTLDIAAESYTLEHARKRKSSP